LKNTLSSYNFLSGFKPICKIKQKKFGQGGGICYWSFDWTNPNFFYSRRIGRTPQGSMPDNDYSDMPEGVHILGAAKVMGKLSGNWNIGAIHVCTRLGCTATVEILE
jgi:hypothetical protein